jgi:hypothetical protein
MKLIRYLQDLFMIYHEQLPTILPDAITLTWKGYTIETVYNYKKGTH